MTPDPLQPDAARPICGAPTEAAPAQTPPAPAGLLIIDKETGFTSMDVCAIVRARLRKGGAPKRIKVGHGGTLDPAATGVLVVLIGKATRLCDTIMTGEKEYIAAVDFSRRSSTDDAEGLLESIGGLPALAHADLVAVLPRFRGAIMQTPPNFSALNIGGVRAYHLARSGQSVPLTPRPVVVHDLELLDFRWPNATLRVVSGKGFYVRSLARDLGMALAEHAAAPVGGMLTGLRRTRVGRFTLDRARRLDDLPRILAQADLATLPEELPPPPG